MKMTYEIFEEVINHFKNNNKFISDFRDILCAYDKRDFIDPCCFSDCESDELLITLLEIIFNDKDHWISYWIFELDCGKDYHPGMALDKDNKEIPLRTEKDLWNLLMENLNDDNEI